MLIDSIFAILIVMAIWKGWTKGFVLAIFSFLAIFIGLAAALKLSAVVAGWLAGSTSIGARWLPVIAFILIMVGVILLVRLGAKLIERSLGMMMLGWVNRIAGILLYAVLYITLFSVVLFYAKQLRILNEPAMTASVVYAHIENWGPKGIEIFGKILPFLKDSFAQLETFFGTVAEKAQ